MSLFKLGRFTSAAGLRLNWKIECEALTSEDWLCIGDTFGPCLRFGGVEGVPTGGEKFAKAMRPHVTEGELLIVDDVLTTGRSIERHRAGRTANGLVLFARGPCPSWVLPIWTYGALEWLR